MSTEDGPKSKEAKRLQKTFPISRVLPNLHIKARIGDREIASTVRRIRSSPELGESTGIKVIRDDEILAAYWHR
jgi:hypothetical protein